MRASVAFFLLACVEVAISNEEGDEEIHFTNSWAVHIDNEDLEAANVIAKKHGFVNQGQIGSLPGYYHFVKNTVGERSRRSLDDHSQTLLKEPKVKWVEQQRILERSKRDVIPGEDELVRRSVARLRQDTAVTIRDPFFTDQWYLQNIGQSSGPRGIDINVLPVWARGLSGKGIVVSVLDDGVDHTHPDLRHNYDPDASFDFNDFDSDPRPHDENTENCHGTKCAGEVAAQANNGICGVGVSFNASIGGIRMLDGKATDTIEGSSLSYRSAYIDIYSCCWGPKDDGKRFGKPGYLANKALQIGAERGRGGLGNVYVWATGNGGLTDDDCNCDGYTTSIYTISIGAISDHGLSTYYTETCASTLAVTFSGGSHRESIENKIVTTDLHHKCTGVFKGTSSAAPLAAGMMALVLESNPRLSWRDVQHIIVETSQVTSPLDEGWKINGAGKRFNHKFGFGRLDASRMVEKALKWKNVDKQKTCPGAIHNTTRFIPASGSLILSANTSACASTASEIRKLEHVQLKVSLQHRHRGDLSVSVISPSGTRSELLTTRRNDHSARGLKEWIFMTVHFWGEDPRGLWTVIVTDNNNNNLIHYVQKVKQGDAEDVTRIFMDDTGKRLLEKSGDINRAQKPPNGRAAQDHVMKTMEDTAGKLFKGNGFAKFVKTKKMHRGKPKNSNAIDVVVTGSKHANSVVKDSKGPPLRKKSKATFSPKKSSKRLVNKANRKHKEIVQVRHNKEAAKKHVKFKNKTPKKTASSKLNKRKDFRKKNTRAKLKLRRLRKSNKNASNMRLNQTLKSSLNRSTSSAVGNSSSSSKPTMLGLITKLLSEIQKNPLVTKIAMEAIKDPAIGRLFGLSGKTMNTLAPNSTDGQKSDLHDNLERNSSLPSTSFPTQKQNKTNTMERDADRASQVEITAQERDGKLDSNKNGGKMYVNTTHTFSENYVDVLINKTLAASGSASGSGSEESGNYWNTGSGRGSSSEDGSAENADKEGMKNPREMGCKKEMTQCNHSQFEGISIIIQSNSSNESSKEIEGEDSFFEVTDQDDGDGVYAEGNGDELFQSVKRVVESDDGPIEFLPAFDRSGINSQNNDDNSRNPCDYSTQSRNISSSFGKHCLENETFAWSTNENPYENEQLANYLALSKLRGSPNGSSDRNEMENHDSKDETEPYYIDKSDETGDAQDEMVAKYSNKDLEVLQEALEEQLSRLSKDPASQKSNAEILARVRDDINHGDIEDLELLEAQITGGKSLIRRVSRSTAPEDEDFEDLDDHFSEGPETFEHVNQEDDELERRRVEHRTEKYKLSQTYYVDPHKYGRDNSGILESWTLILYGTK